MGNNQGRLAAEGRQDRDFPYPCDPFSGVVIDPSSPNGSKTSTTGSEDKSEMTATEKSSAEDGFNETAKLFSYIGRDDQLKSSEGIVSEVVDGVKKIGSEIDPLSLVIPDDEETKEVHEPKRDSKGKPSIAKKGLKAARYTLTIMTIGLIFHDFLLLVIRKIFGMEDEELKRIKADQKALKEELASAREEIKSIKEGQQDISDKVESSSEGIKEVLNQVCGCCKGRIIKLANSDKEKTVQKVAGNVPWSETSHLASPYPSPPSPAPGYAPQLEASHPASSYPTPPASPAQKKK